MLILENTGLGGEYDFEVSEVGVDGVLRTIGRITKTQDGPADLPWFWNVTARGPQTATDRGYQADHEAAMRAFKGALDRA